MSLPTEEGTEHQQFRAQLQTFSTQLNPSITAVGLRNLAINGRSLIGLLERQRDALRDDGQFDYPPNSIVTSGGKLYATGKDTVRHNINIVDNDSRRTHRRFGQIKNGLLQLLDEAYLYFNQSKEQAAQITTLIDEKTSLTQKLEDSEKANKYLAEKSVKNEQRLKDEHRDALQAKEDQISSLKETRNQLEEALRNNTQQVKAEAQLEIDRLKVAVEEAKREHNTLPDAGPWLRSAPEGKKLDDYVDDILLEAQTLLLDPTLFPSIWKNHTKNELTPAEQEVWARAQSPF